MPQPTYIFLDESGDLGFNLRGSKYYVLTSIRAQRPFLWRDALDNYRYDLIEFGLNHEHFHCAEDNSHVRSRVFEMIREHFDQIQVDCVIVQKNKAQPNLQQEKRAYLMVLNNLLRYVLTSYEKESIQEFIVITDHPPKAVKTGDTQALRSRLSSMGAKVRILHHASRSHYGLQLADYCSWAIFRKWERQDTRYYDLIQPALRSEFDFFRRGKTIFY